MKRPWTNAEIRILQERYPDESTSALAVELGRTKSQVYVMAGKLGIKKSDEFNKGPLSGRKVKGELRTWTEEQIRIVQERYPDEQTSDLAALLGKTEQQVQAKAKDLGVKKSEAYLSGDFSGRIKKGQRRGISTEFKKGGTPWSKGKKLILPPAAVATQFKPGNKPHTWRPIGTERIFDGYLQRKMTDTGYWPRDWVFVHRILWEEHNGPIPEGHVVVFKDGNKTHITIENLECISRAELARRNAYHNRYPKELAEVIMLRAAVVRKINRMKRSES